MPKKKAKFIIGIDSGGTKILICLFNRKFELLSECKMKVEAEKGAGFYLKIIKTGVLHLLSKHKIPPRHLIGIGIGCPGMVNHAHGIIELAPNLPFLKAFPLKKKLEKIFKTPVIVENDVNAGLFGEHQFGAAKGYHNVVGIFLGTGVGGALILNGKLYRGTSGGAGELGHMWLDLIPHWTLERIVGRLAISSEAAALASRNLAPQLFELAGTDIRKMKSKVLKKSIASGDKAVEQLLQEKARTLGIAMASLVHILNPELFVLGGGLIEAVGSRVVTDAKRTMKQFAMKPLVQSVEVVSSKLLDYAVAKGAAKLMFDAAFGSDRP